MAPTAAHHRLIGPAPAAMLALALLFGCSTPAVGQPTDETGGLAELPPAFPKEDDALIAWIEAQLEALGDVRKIGRDTLAEAHRTVSEAIAGGEYHHDTFPESPNRARGDYLLARALYLNADRYLGEENAAYEAAFGDRMPQEELLALRERYDAKILALIESTLSREPSAELRGLVHELRGELLVRRARPCEGAEALEKAIEAYPGHPALDELTIKLAEAYLNCESYAKAYELCVAALAKFPRSRFWPHYFFFAHKSARSLGWLEKGLALWETYLPGLRARCGEEPIPIEGEEPFVTPEEYRIDSQRYVDRAGFYRGFYLYALGRTKEAQEAFRAYSNELHERISEGEVLEMTTKVYLEFQADPMERRMSLFDGVPAPGVPEEFTWLAPPSPEDPDTPVTRLRLFLTPGDARTGHSGLIALLARLSNEYAARGLRIEWIAPAANERLAPREAEGVRAVAAQHRLGWALGVDVGPNGPFYYSHQVPTGGSLIFLVDAKGELAWQLIYPMHWDEGLIRRVLERVLPPEAGTGAPGSPGAPKAPGGTAPGGGK